MPRDTRTGRFITAEQLHEMMFEDAEARFLTAPDDEALDALTAWTMLIKDRVRHQWEPVLDAYREVFG